MSGRRASSRQVRAAETMKLEAVRAMKVPDLSVIIVWDAGHAIARMMEANQRWFRSHNVEVLIINGGEDQRRLRELLVPAGPLSLGMVRLPVPCNHALGINIGMQFSRSRKLLLLGPNHVLQSDLIGKAIQVLNDDAYLRATTVSMPDAESYWPRIKEQCGSNVAIRSILTRRTLKATFADGIEVEVEASASELVENTRSAVSVIAVKKQDLGRIGGYNSDIQWAEWISADVQLRLKKISGLKCVQDGEIVKLRDSETPAGRSRSMTDEFFELNLLCERYSRGDVWGTYSRDIGLWRNKLQIDWINPS